MCDIAEAVASRKAKANGDIEAWATSKETFRALARRVREEKGDDPFLKWARWLLLERDSELGSQLLR